LKSAIKVKDKWQAHELVRVWNDASPNLRGGGRLAKIAVDTWKIDTLYADDARGISLSLSRGLLAVVVRGGLRNGRESEGICAYGGGCDSGIEQHAIDVEGGLG
jgi:hypothetical protein